MTTEALQRPPSLRHVLDAGGDLTQHVRVDQLCEVVFGCQSIPLVPPGERGRRADQHRWGLEEMLAGRDFAGRGPRKFRQDFVTIWAWEGEMHDDPTLVDRVIASLPDHVVNEGRADFDLWRRPHPLTVETPSGWWQCNSCGTCFDQGEAEALIIRGREGHSELDYEIPFCSACIRMAADTMEATR